MIHVLAVITTKAGLRDQLLAIFRANVPNVLKEDGCIEYGAAIDLQSGREFQTPFGPDVMLVIEKWASVEALEAHFTTPHMQEYSARTKPLIESRIIHMLSPETGSVYGQASPVQG